MRILQLLPLHNEKNCPEQVIKDGKELVKKEPDMASSIGIWYHF